MKNNLKLYVLLFFSASLWYACTEDYFDGDISTDDWQPRLALPLVNSTLTLEDIIIKSDTNGLVRKDPNNDNLLEVIYDDRVKSPQGALAVDIPNQSFREAFQLPVPIPPNNNGGTESESFSGDFSFDNNNSDLEIDSILLKNGMMSFDVTNDFRHNVLLSITFPTIRDNNGSVLNVSLNLPPAPSASTPSITDSDIDLRNFNINMSEDENGMPAINKIPYTMDAVFNLTPNTGSNLGDAITLDMNLNNLNFKELYGYVGQIDLKIDEDSIITDMFKNFISGDIFFLYPTLDLGFDNSFGLPIDFEFEKLIAVNNDKSPSKLDFELPPGPISLNAPTGIGSARTELLLDTNNSNIDDVISFLLKKLIYESVGKLNPDGRLINRNFLTDTSNIALDLKLRIPFDGSASNFKLVDTIDFEFENRASTEDALIRINAVNGFPLDMKLQVIFADANFNPVDSLFINDADPPIEQPVIEASMVDANGKTVQSTSKTTDVVVSPERLDKWQESEYTIIIAELQSSSAASTVRFFEDYRFSINVGIKTQFSIN